MPIRPELRKFYGREWREVTRPRILLRAGNCCEQCKAPNRSTVIRFRSPSPYAGWWFEPSTGRSFANDGEYMGRWRPLDMPTSYRRDVRIVITIGHINQMEGDDRDENLKAWCQYCHLKHDRSQHARNAKETRLTRKDAARPLLQIA